MDNLPFVQSECPTNAFDIKHTKMIIRAALNFKKNYTAYAARSVVVFVSSCHLHCRLQQAQQSRATSPIMSIAAFLKGVNFASLLISCNCCPTIRKWHIMA